MKRLNFKTITFTIVFCSISLVISSQALQRQCIASSSNYISDNGIIVQQTIGQPFNTIGFFDDELSVHPGFQQSIFDLEVVYETPNLKLNVYPNPAASSVIIESPEIIENATINIVDISGKILISQNFSELKDYLINCDSWSNGFYYITVTDNKNNKYTSRLIITK